MKEKIKTLLLICAMFGFWGMIYPDLCFTEDICRIVYTNEAETGTGSSDEVKAIPEEDIFTALSHAAPGQIRIKSRFLEVITGKKTADSERKENVSRQ